MNSKTVKTLGEIAKYVDGKLQGDPAVVITRIVHPALVRGPEDLALPAASLALTGVVDAELSSLW